MYKTLKLLIVGIMAALLFAGCDDDAKVASHNLSKAADNFEIDRRVVFYNGITGEYMLSIEGKCSIENHGNRLAVVCKTGPSMFKKHFLGLSHNVTYFSEHLYPTKANRYHYRTTFKPQQILPDIDFRGSTEEAVNALTPDTKD
jgi:hypothetical protein